MHEISGCDRAEARVVWWAGKDSNLGSRWQQIYSLPPLSTWVPALTSQSLSIQPCGRKNKPSRSQFSSSHESVRRLLFRMDTSAILEAGNFTNDVAICQVAMACFFTSSTVFSARCLLESRMGKCYLASSSQPGLPGSRARFDCKTPDIRSASASEYSKISRNN